MKNLCLFDLDHTLIPIDSDHAWGEFMLRQGWADPVEFGRCNDVFFEHYQAGTLDIHEYIEFATRPWRDRPAAEQAAAQAAFLREVIGPVLSPAARALVRKHQDSGDLVAIVTATNEFVTAPIAQAFGVDHLLAVRLERGPAGNITGRIDGIPSFREGKTQRTEQWLAGLGTKLQDFGRISVYSDSTNDLPLLELATDPIATNPSPSLETIARARNWRILQLFS
jgi:HAD superfamily hydrolase (TIGR01490 family)